MALLSLNVPLSPISDAGQTDFLDERFANLKVEVMQKMVTDTFNRLTRKGKEDLEGGIFSPNEYFNLLKSHLPAAKKRIEWLRGKQAFEIGYAPGNHFQMVKTSELISGFIPFQWKLKEGAIPSEALKDLFAGPSLFASGVALGLVQAQAFAELMGLPSFNYLFTIFSKYPLEIGRPETRAMSCFLPLQNVRPDEIRKGDYVSIQNVEEMVYGRKHPEQLYQGIYDALCCGANISGAPLFTGLGLPPQGVTLKEIKEILRQNFNAPFDSESSSELVKKKMPSLFENARSFSDCQASPEEFEALGGGRIVCVFREDMREVVKALQMVCEDKLKQNIQ